RIDVHEELVVGAVRHRPRDVGGACRPELVGARPNQAEERRAMSPRGSIVPATAEKKITRGDIESKLRELQGEVDENIQSARGVASAVAIGAGVLLVVAAYWFGRRRGKKRQLVLEIKRI